MGVDDHRFNLDFIRICLVSLKIMSLGKINLIFFKLLKLLILRLEKMLFSSLEIETNKIVIEALT